MVSRGRFKLGILQTMEASRGKSIYNPALRLRRLATHDNDRSRIKNAKTLHVFELSETKDTTLAG